MDSSDHIVDVVIKCDIHETDSNIPKLLAQSSHVEIKSLNTLGYADYLWECADGHLCQFERKQNNELLSDMTHVENQLREEMHYAEETNLIIQGVFVPYLNGVCTYHTSKDGKVLYRGEYFKTSYAAVMSWLYQLDKHGVTHYIVPNTEAVVATLSALHSNSLEKKHTTLQRYIKKRATPWVPNQHVMSLMQLENAGIGEVTAKLLIARFGTVWNVLNASVKELCELEGIGVKTAMKLFNAVGRKIDK